MDESQPDCGQLLKVVNRHHKEDEKERWICESAEPIVATLAEGENVLCKRDFQSVVRYLLRGEKSREAKRSGAFVLGKIKVKRGSARV
jgi:aminoglycoside/choline kinase family phosphotransferase